MQPKRHGAAAAAAAVPASSWRPGVGRPEGCLRAACTAARVARKARWRGQSPPEGSHAGPQKVLGPDGGGLGGGGRRGGAPGGWPSCGPTRAGWLAAWPASVSGETMGGKGKERQEAPRWTLPSC
jgi:hypothetical protein